MVVIGKYNWDVTAIGFQIKFAIQCHLVVHPEHQVVDAHMV